MSILDHPEHDLVQALCAAGEGREGDASQDRPEPYGSTGASSGTSSGTSSASVARGRARRALATRMYAHRGFSSRQPEMTVAAYRAAIEWAGEAGLPLGLECDVQLSADRIVVCMHDLTLDRTAGVHKAVAELTCDELSQIDFGSWRTAEPDDEQRHLTTLAQLLLMVAAARAAGLDVTVAVETKHPNPHGTAVDEQVAKLLNDAGWAGADSPVRMISFSLEALAVDAELLPLLPKTLLMEEFGAFADGSLPEGVSTAGPSLHLLRSDPGYVARAHAHGHEVHVWTVNEPADILWCLSLGVDAITTDYPDRLLAWSEQDPEAG